MPKTFLVKTSRRRESRLNSEGSIHLCTPNVVHDLTEKSRKSRECNRNEDVYEVKDLDINKDFQKQDSTRTNIFMPEVHTERKNSQSYKYIEGERCRKDSALQQPLPSWKRELAREDTSHCPSTLIRNAGDHNSKNVDGNEVYSRDDSPQEMDVRASWVDEGYLVHDDRKDVIVQRPIAKLAEHCRCGKYQENCCRFVFNGLKKDINRVFQESDMHNSIRTRYASDFRAFKNYSKTPLKGWRISGRQNESMMLKKRANRTESFKEIERADLNRSRELESTYLSSSDDEESVTHQDTRMHSLVSNKEKYLKYPKTGNDADLGRSYDNRGSRIPHEEIYSRNFAAFKHRVDQWRNSSESKGQSIADDKKIRLRCFSLTVGWKSPTRTDDCKPNCDSLSPANIQSNIKRTNCKTERNNLHTTYTHRREEKIFNRDDFINDMRPWTSRDEERDERENSHNQTTPVPFWKSNERQHLDQDDVKMAQGRKRVDSDENHRENLFIKKEITDSDDDSSVSMDENVSADLIIDETDTNDRTLKRKHSQTFDKVIKRTISLVKGGDVESKYSSKLWVPEGKVLQIEDRNIIESEDIVNKEQDNSAIKGYNKFALVCDRVNQSSNDKDKGPVIRHFKEKEAGKKSRAMANWLERKRVAELNAAFELLRNIVPTYGNEDRTLSKIKTLRYASTYINHLAMIHEEQCRFGSNDVKEDLNKLFGMDPLLQRCQEHLETRCVI